MRSASVAGLVGLALVVLGALGFVPGVVRHYGELRWWNGSGAELFGVFRTSVALNLVHLGFGVAGLVGVARRWYLSGTGALAFALGVLGLLGTRLPVNRADDWLHLGLGVALLYLGAAFSLGALRPAT